MAAQPVMNDATTATEHVRNKRNRRNRCDGDHRDDEA